MMNNSINLNHLSPRTTEHQKTKTSGIGNQVPGLGQAHIRGSLNWLFKMVNGLELTHYRIVNLNSLFIFKKKKFIYFFIMYADI